MGKYGVNISYQFVVYRKLRLLGVCAYNFRRNFLKILSCLLSTCAYNAVCHLWSPHI